MSKVITFSTTYPSYHNRKGQDTYFVEKMIQWYWDTCDNNPYQNVESMIKELNGDKFSMDYIQNFVSNLLPDIEDWKSHTIREGCRFVSGEYFKPCIWTGRPYHTSQLQFLPELKLKVWEIGKLGSSFFMDNKTVSTGLLEKISRNDGLEWTDFHSWFSKAGKNKKWHGSIYCWNENINY